MTTIRTAIGNYIILLSHPKLLRSDPSFYRSAVELFGSLQINHSRKMSTAKLDYLKKIEAEVQQRWEEQKLGQSNAPEPTNAQSPPQPEAKSGKKNKRKKSSNQPPATTPSVESAPMFGDDKKKFFCCFPYPYMNGKLHLGHTFSLSKCEFTARYKLLQGYNVLFPFGFHCTGMPIKACADKLKREIELYGNPPVFPEEEEGDNDDKDKDAPELKIGQDKSKGKKSKAVAKAGSSKWQWNIMLSLGIPEEIIPNFAEDIFWLNYFPHHAVDDLKKMGLYVDWRRSFITTEINPVYDSFIRWQFNLLYKKQKIQYGKRYCIFSPKDDQPCMDHDRSTGEGVGPQEYTLVKLKLEQPYPQSLKKLNLKDQVNLVAATLCPETMYGQTNCWVHPDIEYILVQTKQHGIFVCSKRSARNMAYQDILVSEKVEPIASIKGSELIDCAVSSSLSHYPKFYVLPLSSIKEDKGTGVVTSVPSGAPDDYVAWKDLVNNKAYRERWNIPLEHVANFEPISTSINDDLGEFPAIKVCDEMGITSPNDKERLRIAKEKVYLKGFYENRMSVGEFKGQKVQDVKNSIKANIINSNNGLKYMEPEKEVISRSADECVVALCNQWFLTYGDETWKNEVRNALKTMNVYHDEVRRNFEATIDWYQEHACSRTYGLGTKLPWDPKWLIESLSDSTIYMAYYTIKHILEGLEYIPGKKFGVDPKLLTDEVWSYIFFIDAPVPEKSGIDINILNKCRREFQYWYPVDLRVSGKDLVQNHLTYFIYNHVAIWDKQPDKWPKGIRANGHLLLNSEKMSKSTGNFMTLKESIDRFGADAMRFALADSGDSIEDANFVVNVADSTILRLYTFLEWAKKLVETKDTYRKETTGDYKFQDSYFENKFIQLTDESQNHYEQILFKEAVKSGFFEMLIARDQYREICGGETRMKLDLLLEYIKVQAILISPVCPHVADHIWTNILGLSGGVAAMRWPAKRTPDAVMLKSADYFFDTIRMFRSRLTQFLTSTNKKNAKQAVIEHPTNAVIWVAKTYPEWQATILNHLAQEYKSGSVPENNKLAAHFAKLPELKKYQKKVMPFVQKVKIRVEAIGAEKGLQQTVDFDEVACLKSNASYISGTLEIERLQIISTDTTDDEKIKQECCPGAPYITFGYCPKKSLKLINPQPLTGLTSVETFVLNDENVEKLKERLVKERHLQGRKVALYRYADPVLGPRKIPVPNILSTGRLVAVSEKDTLVFEESSPSLKLITSTNGKSSQIEIGNELLYLVDVADA